MNMRKEIVGIFLFFLVVLSFFSLLSFNPADPSLNHAVSSHRIYNVFGIIGAHFSGLLIGLFGIGAFWIPVLLLIFCLHYFSGKENISPRIITGGIILVITTGCLLDGVGVFGDRFLQSTLITTPLSFFLKTYANTAGSRIILILLLVIGLILATGFSIAVFFVRMKHYFSVAWTLVVSMFNRLKSKKIDFKKFKKVKTVRQEPAPPRTKVKVKKAKPEVEDKSGITIQTRTQPPVRPVPAPRQEVFNFMEEKDGFKLPSFNLLNDIESDFQEIDKEYLHEKSKLLENKLNDFGVKGKVCTVTPGPVITTFEYKPAPGVKISKVVNLSDDLALALKAISIRIIAPIPGKDAIGIEIPNKQREMVGFKEIVTSPVFEKSKSKLSLSLIHI